MHLLQRDLIRERLRLKRGASYRLIGTTKTGLINSDHVVELLNRCRRGPQAVLHDIPSDLKTAEELCAALPELSGVEPSKIVQWTRRRKNPPPFFLLTQQLRRFRLSDFREWLIGATRPRRFAR